MSKNVESRKVDAWNRTTTTSGWRIFPAPICVSYARLGQVIANLSSLSWAERAIRGQCPRTTCEWWHCPRGGGGGGEEVSVVRPVSDTFICSTRAFSLEISRASSLIESLGIRHSSQPLITLMQNSSQQPLAVCPPSGDGWMARPGRHVDEANWLAPLHDGHQLRLNSVYRRGPSPPPPPPPPPPPEVAWYGPEIRGYNGFHGQIWNMVLQAGWEGVVGLGKIWFKFGILARSLKLP
jgi:hypothetical protein